MTRSAPALFSADTFAGGLPHELFARLRAEPGLPWLPDDQEGFWAVTRHAEVVEASRDPSLFSSAARANALSVRPEQIDAVRQMSWLDPPEHKAVRILVQRSFTRSSVLRQTDLVRSVVREVLDRALAKGSFDLADDVAEAIPAEVIGVLLGVDPQDRADVARWAHLTNSGEDPAYAEDIGQEQPWMRLREYGARRRAELARTGPDGTLAADLNEPTSDGPLSDEWYELNFAFLALAGNQTTRDAINSGVLALLEHPDQRQRLQDDPGVSVAAAEEILRWSAPVIYYSRAATADTVLGGQPIAAGERVALYIASANFDEAVFDRPLTFDIGRSPNPHITFGGAGPHVCLGAHLARLEIQVLLQELAGRIERLELAGQPQRLRSHQVNGFRQIPVRVR